MKFRSTLFVAISSLALFARARAADSLPLVQTNLPFLAPDRAEKLDLYLPAPPAAGKLSPAVVWIHGGGWTGGTKSEARAKEICTTLARAGYVAVSIDYKLGDGAWPQDLLDCKNGVRYLRAHAAEYHLDPARIAVAGGSAGGHLALMVAFTAGKKDLESDPPYPGVSSAVRCVIDMYGITDLVTRRSGAEQDVPTATAKLVGSTVKVFGAKSVDDKVLRIASPVTHITKDSPPVLILHGRADPTVDFQQAEELDRVLSERGVEHQLIALDGIGHTFDWETWSKKPLPRDLRPVALDFLAKHLGARTVSAHKR